MAINDLVDLRTSKEVQKLIGSLQKYIFYETTSAYLHFINSNKTLTSPPHMATPDEGELLYVYLDISEQAVSSVMLREVGGEQRSIYFVSKTFTDSQMRYLPLKRLVLALIVTLRKLMHFFRLIQL